MHILTSILPFDLGGVLGAADAALRLKTRGFHSALFFNTGPTVSARTPNPPCAGFFYSLSLPVFIGKRTTICIHFL